MGIPEHIIEEVKSRSSITEVTSEFVQLKRAGSNQVGLCPFHSEKSPSFTVREEQGTFHCFGCGKHGNVFTLLMELRGMNFPEAVRYLARKAGVDIPESTSGDREQEELLRKNRLRARVVMAKASEIFQNCLQQRGSVSSYLRERGLSESSIKSFQLGFAPDSRNFLLQAIHNSLDELKAHCDLRAEELPDLLVELGLLKRREGNPKEVYDVFRNRVIFPIARSDGATIAFGGRILPQDDFQSKAPKYLNSCETLLYSKRQTLYGLPQAMKEMRSTRQAYLVEGYMDVIGVHQAGFQNVVATCGTAVTEQHAHLLRRFVERAIILFDGDAAGSKAAANCFEAFLNSGLDCFVVALPDGEDPDTFAQKLSQSAFQEYLESHKRALFDVYLEHLLREFNPNTEELTATMSGKAASRLAQVFSKVKNSVEREFLMRRSAERLGVTVSSFEKLVQEAKSSQSRMLTSRADIPARPKRFVASPERRQEVPFVMDSLEVIQSATSSTEASKRSPFSPSPGFAVPGAKAKTTAASRTQIQKKALKFYHQLLIAVVCEPTLCEELLKLHSLEESQGQIHMPEKLRRFLTAVQQRILGEGVQEGAWDSPFGEAVAEPLSDADLLILLQEFGFPAEQVLSEARLQRGAKGNVPEALIQLAPMVSHRQKIEREIDLLRTKQNEQTDVEYQLKIAQEKLEKKRSLERMNRG